MGPRDEMKQALDNPLWREHFGLVISASVGGFVVLHLLGVANWDVTTALAIASVSGTTTVALGSILASLPILYSGALLYLLPTIVGRLARRTPVERSAALLALSMPIMLVIYLAPLITLLAGIAGIAAVWALAKYATTRRRRLRRSGKPAPEPEPVSRFERYGVLAGSWLMLLVLTVSVPWFPTENLRIGDGPTFTGYVIGARDQDLVVLRDKTRVIVVTPAATLSRALCSKDEVDAKSVRQFVSKPKYEACISGDG